jgi:REP element-mobilizing transposase RayT
MASVVAPGMPHHMTQRGNRRQEILFSDNDYRAYLELMTEWCSLCAVEVWASILMPNHVHLIAVPESEQGLRRAKWRGTSALYPKGQFQGRMAGASVAGAVSFRRYSGGGDSSGAHA